jgi:hypothetical protein
VLRLDVPKPGGFAPQAHHLVHLLLLRPCQRAPGRSARFFREVHLLVARVGVRKHGARDYACRRQAERGLSLAPLVEDCPVKVLSRVRVGVGQRASGRWWRGSWVFFRLTVRRRTAVKPAWRRWKSAGLLSNSSGSLGFRRPGLFGRRGGGFDCEESHSLVLLNKCSVITRY